MSPNIKRETGPHGRDVLAAGPRPFVDLTPEEIDYYMRRGQKLRAEAFADIMRAIGTALRNAARFATGATPAASDDALAQLAGRLRTPLDSIRSSAETLRDNPNIGADDRDRVVTQMLAEEARLEALLSAMLDASSIESRRRVWRVPLQPLVLERAAHAHGA
jgi:signal transduction histidine kinase